MLFPKIVSEIYTDDDGCEKTRRVSKRVLFKDSPTINHRGAKDQAENIKKIADALKTGDHIHETDGIFYDASIDSSSPHNPQHEGCSPFGLNGDKGSVVEKRICKCMFYYNSCKKDPAMCARCKLEEKWNNVGNISIEECEVPTKHVVRTVGGVDLILKDSSGHLYATELKPEKSKETLARMIAEIFTALSYGLDLAELDTEEISPAICFFEGSLQHKDFCELLSNNSDFKFLLAKVKVFYITIQGQKGGVTDFIIQANDLVPLKKY